MGIGIAIAMWTGAVMTVISLGGARLSSLPEARPCCLGVLRSAGRAAGVALVGAIAWN